LFEFTTTVLFVGKPALFLFISRVSFTVKFWVLFLSSFGLKFKLLLESLLLFEATINSAFKLLEFFSSFNSIGFFEFVTTTFSLSLVLFVDKPILFLAVLFFLFFTINFSELETIICCFVLSKFVVLDLLKVFLLTEGFSSY
jgi:hypothetical protein